MSTILEAYGKDIVGAYAKGYKEVSWESWNSMTDEQRESIPEAHITGAPGADGNLDADIFTKLWENPDPTAAFAAQNITLSSDDYDFLLFIFSNKDIFSTSIYYDSAIIKKGESVCFQAGNTRSDSYQLNIRTRSLTYTSNTVYSAGDGKRVAIGSGEATVNTDCIPIAIYGIKKSINLQFSAIASDVSTSASKCMLNTGKSVEDAITANKRGTNVDLSTYNTFANRYTFPSDGYLYMYIHVNTNIAQAHLYGANDSLIGSPRLEGTAYLTSLTYVKKGMKCYVQTNYGSNNDVHFSPLEA